MDTIPELLSTVRLINRDDVYLVVDLNHGRKVVEVVSITGTLQVIPDVPVSGIKELVEGPPIYLQANSMVDQSMEKRRGDLSPVQYCSGQVGRFRPCVTFERTGQQMDEAEVATLVENAGSDPPESRVHK